MAYEVTATRRRPQKFDDLVGQEFVANTLKNSIQSGRIAHAYLFSGPRGCGKTSSARIMAKALNCEKGPTTEPCGVCDACREIARGASLDVREIDGASNTSVNDVREIKDEVVFPPNSSRYKIYIIDEVHMLSTSAFNALLKTIEEPPEYVIFIFATTELQKVPATIKSRCQQFNFHLVPIERLKNLLGEAASEIGIKADDEALYWIAKESTGSVRDAYTLFDQVAAFSDGEITYEKIRDKLGLVGIEQLNSIFEKCSSGDTEKTLEELDLILQNGITIEQFITNSAQYIRSIMLIKAGVTKESLLGQSAERYSKSVLENWDKVRIERALSLFLALYRYIRYSLSPRYELDLAFSRLCNLRDAASSSEIKMAIEATRKLLVEGAPSSAISPMQERQRQREPSINPSIPQFSMLSANTSENRSENVGAPEKKEEPQSAPHSEPSAIPMFSALKGSETPKESAPTKTEEPLPKVEPIKEEPKQESAAPQSVAPVAPAAPSTENAIDAETLKRETIEELKYNEVLAAGALSEVDFEISGNKIIATAPNQYQQMQLEVYKKQIIAALKKVSGKEIEFESAVQKEIVREKVDIPKSVQILRDEFRGTIVGGKI